MLLKEILKNVILLFLLCNIPGFLLVYFGETMGSISSYLTSAMLLVYFLISKPWRKPAIPFLIFSITYFIISGLNNTIEDEISFIKETIRFFIILFCVNEVLHDTKYKELFYILLLGGLSIIINGLIFPETNKIFGLIKGRYSGFFINPNTAGIVCLLGIALSYKVKSDFWRITGQLILTIAGLLTLSRTFIIIWLLITVLSIKQNKKNIILPVLGSIGIILMLTFGDSKRFAGDRFDALTSFFDDGPVKTETIQHDSRAETWAQYYDLIMEKPFFGHGYKSFQVFSHLRHGAHNSYLMVFGEGGIISFIIFISIYIYLLYWSLKSYKSEATLLYICLVILLNMSASHTYFFNYQSITLSIFLLIKIRAIKEKKNEN
ncbi:O-antigen ligase family protein [Croceivirga sp. JEA036]|uniref:O-antigen ligase family protein n=1 Tax=Croceivirga sp. JEA036 TaxID=2721162 RepID=UPI001439A939|nr:O-antigen ligase family protein [Croceivirga sp. JEA036]NJB35365.1 O-antigen ligase family protein [Croceivirga sp. JEA036]